jgi:hypothetical protein
MRKLAICLIIFTFISASTLVFGSISPDPGEGAAVSVGGNNWDEDRCDYRIWFPNISYNDSEIVVYNSFDTDNVDILISTLSLDLMIHSVVFNELPFGSGIYAEWRYLDMTIDDVDKEDYALFAGAIVDNDNTTDMLYFWIQSFERDDISSETEDRTLLESFYDDWFWWIFWIGIVVVLLMCLLIYLLRKKFLSRSRRTTNL